MSFVRNSSTGVVINTDELYYKSLLAKRDSKKESNKLNEEISELKNELSSIKTLLEEVINGRKNV